MTEPTRNVEAIFLAALERTTLKERQAYVDGACSSDAAVRSRVLELLQAHEASHGPLDTPPSDLRSPTSERPHTAEQPGTQIGPYKLLQVIGEGGMGVVYMAEQTEPVKRRVALKIIKPGMDSHQVIARFQAEQQALAMMDHPNIARVLEAGATDSGHPYFAMELVRGVPITEYCDERRLTPRQRLMLFLQVCNAVQHAHQKGVIHRDIKPSNVLVADYDDVPVPKVIDFGLAKAISLSLTEMTNFTRFGQIVGTFEYMSPEQAKFNQLNVDTRTDIYSLGVLLYELLTGSTPLNRERLRNAALDELLRIIRDEDPPKPSLRISCMGQGSASHSHRHNIDTKKLLRLVRGDLDWIAMKSLEKDRARRYETASELAADVRRYLNDEHVLASSPGTIYRLRKALRRHWRWVSAAALILLCLVGGILGTALGMVRAKDTLATLKEELKSTAVFHAMNYDVGRMRNAVKGAQAAGATEGWANSILASAAIMSGDPESAHELLAEAVAMGEDTVSVHALLAQSQLYTDNPEGYMQEYEYLLKADPQGIQDRLHCAMALTFMKPARAFELADQAFTESRSPVALSVLAMTRIILASDTGDYTETKRGLEEATAAAIMLPDSPATLTIALFGHAVAYHLAEEDDNQLEMSHLRDTGHALTRRLMAAPGRNAGIAVDFYVEIGDLKQATIVCQRLLASDNSTSIRQRLIHILLRQNEREAAAQMIAEISPSANLSDAERLIAAEEDGVRHDMRTRLLDDLHNTSWDDGKVRVLGMLCLMGFADDATVEATRICGEQADHEPFHKELFRYFAGKSDRHKLVDLAGTSRNTLCAAHYLAGCRLLGCGNRDGARAEFSECRGFVGHVDREMALTLLKCLDDPHWPHWIPD